MGLGLVAIESLARNVLEVSLPAIVVGVRSEAQTIRQCGHSVQHVKVLVVFQKSEKLQKGSRRETKARQCATAKVL